MNAPLPRRRTITASGSKQRRDARSAVIHAVMPAVTVLITVDPFLTPLSGKRSELERERVGSAAARHRIARLHALRQCDDRVAVRATHAVCESRRPAAIVLPHTERVPSTVRALDEVSGSHVDGKFEDAAAVRTTHDRHRQIPSSRWRRPRSKPTMTASSTVMTGTAIRPVFAINSSRAAASSATFLAVNSTPRDERNSFAAWQECQAVDQ